MHRRTYLGCCTGAVAALAGCFGGGGAPLEDHPAGADLDAQPTLGPAPGSADGTIVAFEDPSCPSCARFEGGTFPELKANLVDPGTVSFVFRAIPVVRAWAEPAVLALESVHARDAAAFWALKRFYFRNQASIDGGTVRDATRQFLSEETAVDADAVLADVDSGAYSDHVDANLQAARDADLQGTPTFYLFDSGSFTTDLVGPQDYSVFENALGV